MTWYLRDFTGAVVAQGPRGSVPTYNGTAPTAPAWSADTSSGPTVGALQDATQGDVGAVPAAASSAASQDAGYAGANRLTMSVDSVSGGLARISGHRIPGSTVYVSV